ncbi:MAG: glutathione peroxidase [Eubacterium sp.]|nr:glutathione peroxidase [Eubacterium sp.]
MNIYDFKVKNRLGEEVDLADYKGKVLMIVNTATGCGFTPQYEGLENLYRKYKEQGFEILDFPCNQFGHQAPGSDDEIHEFCTSKYDTSFPRFAKIDVNGENADPLFQYLTANTKFEGFSGPMGMLMKGVVKKMDKDYKNNGNIKWNFTKFLINRDGEIAARFESTETPEKIDEEVAKLL